MTAIQVTIIFTFSRRLATTLLTLGFLIVQSAAASAASACGGKNLLDDLETNQPDVFATIRSEAAETINGEATLWRIETEGAETSYLLGTIHMTDPRVATLSPQVQEIISRSRTVALELKDVGNKAAVQAKLATRPDLMVMPGGQSMFAMLPEDERKAAEAAILDLGIPRFAADKLRPWLPATAMALSACETQRNRSGHPTLDLAVEQLAKRHGAEMIGLETAMEQFEALSGMPLESQVMFLRDAVRMRDNILDLNETMIQLYLQNRITWFMPFSRILSGERSEEREEAESGFMRVLIDKRNVNMAERSQPLIDRGAAFIAVGALHLPGENGVVELLREKGYTVTAIN